MLFQSEFPGSGGAVAELHSGEPLAHLGPAL